MSIRAHRAEVKHSGRESFNLWHDDKLLDFFDKENSGWRNPLNMDSCGLVEFSIELLEKAIKEVPMEESQIKVLQEDIEWAKKRDDEYIYYYCF